ncbi:MAG: YqgE/AlgH family protein [Bacteroidota bacterium]
MDYFTSDKIIEPARGDLLISEPYLPDPNFERTVVLLCEHDDNGTFGYVLNKRSGFTLSEVVKDVSLLDSDVYVGGPVQKDSLHFIHRIKDFSDEEKEIMKDVYWGGDFEDLISKIDTGQVPKGDIKFFLGYSGWSSGQLMDELEQKSWIVCKGVDQSIVFDVAPERMWRTVLRRMGGKFKMIADYPIDPRMN